MDDFEEALETALELAGEAPAAEKKLTKDSTDLSLRHGAFRERWIRER